MSQLTIASSSMGPSGGPPSSQPSSSATFNLQNYQEDCDSEYLEALEALADAEAEDGEDDSYFFYLVAQAEKTYPREVLNGMVKELKQRGLIHFIQNHVIQRRADVKVLLVALDVCLPRALLNPDVPDVKLIPILKSALSRILRKRLRLTQYSTPYDVVKLLKNARKIIILSGAGISVSVGIPDFRSKDGIYAQLQREGKYHLDDPTDMFDKRFFQQDPTCFYDFVHSLWPSEFTPSPTHYFIKLLEDRGQLLRDYTQNIDTLEHQAGIKRVLPCHGSFATASCTEPGCTYRCKGEDISSAVFQRRVPLCPRCNAPLIDDDDDEEEPSNGHGYPASTDVKPSPAGPSAPRASKKGKAKKSKTGWGPGESEEDDAEDEEWVQGGRAGIGLSSTHAPTEVLGQLKPKIAGGPGSGPGPERSDSPKRPLRRSASGRSVESPLQAGAGQTSQRNWKGVIKPDVVFFGEKLPDDFDRLLLEDRDQVDLLLVMGTSLKVAPVSELVSHIPHSTPVVLINRTPVTHIAMDVQLLGDADEIISWLCRRLGWELPGPHSAYGLAKDSKETTVPASQPDDRSARGLLDHDYEPKQAGSSPVWLWPNAQGGRVVEYLEHGAKLDEFGRLAASSPGDFGAAGSSFGDRDAEENGDAGSAYLGLPNQGHLTPDIRYLPPGVVGDSQASTSPALSHLSASRQPASPPPHIEADPGDAGDLPPQAAHGDLNGQSATNGKSSEADELKPAPAPFILPATASLVSSSPSASSSARFPAANLTETKLEMRTDPAVSRAGGVVSQAAVNDRPVLFYPDVAAGRGDQDGGETGARRVAERRPRDSDGDEAELEALAAAKRARQDVGPA